MYVPFKWNKSRGYTYREHRTKKFVTMDWDWIACGYSFSHESYLVKRFRDFYEAYIQIRMFFEKHGKRRGFMIPRFNSCAYVVCLREDAPKIKRMVEKLINKRCLWIKQKGLTIN